MISRRVCAADLLRISRKYAAIMLKVPSWPIFSSFHRILHLLSNLVAKVPNSEAVNHVLREILALRRKTSEIPENTRKSDF